MRKNSEPQKMGDLLPLDDLRAAEEYSKRTKRDYQRKKPYKAKKPVRARFKAKFFFKDGNQTTKYSYDFVNTSNGVLVDEWKGLTKLEELINKWSCKISTVTIYANTNPHPLTSSQEYNLKVKSMSINWLTWNTNVKFKQDGTSVFAVFEPLVKVVSKPRQNV